MLLNYLYANFLEDHDFARTLGTTPSAVKALIEAQLCPAHSYTYVGDAQAQSFVAEVRDQHRYRFHLRGHDDWYRDVARLGITTPAQARAQFFARYDAARQAFGTDPLGAALIAYAPDVPAAFDAAHADATWGHFLNGVYGVCTRDGHPETVFRKQAYVMFIDRMLADRPQGAPPADVALLRRAVDALDCVLSDFAPHEAAHASRQRCIVDVRARFLG